MLPLSFKEFIYFNDDMYPVLPCTENDFFHDGKSTIGFRSHVFANGMFKKHVRNSDRLARKAADKRACISFIRPQHICSPMLRSACEEVAAKVGDEIEIVPGIKSEQNGKPVWRRITTKVTSLVAGGKSMKTVNPGGLISIGTSLDPALTKSDGLTGRMLGKSEHLPAVVHDFTMKTTLLDRVVGSSSDLKVDEIKSNEPLMLSIGTATTVGVVKSGKSGSVQVTLKIPVCVLKGQRVAISRRISNKWRLIGYGIIEI